MNKKTKKLIIDIILIVVVLLASFGVSIQARIIPLLLWVLNVWLTTW